MRRPTFWSDVMRKHRVADRATGRSSKEELRLLIGDKAHVIVDEFQDFRASCRMVLALLDLLAPAGGCRRGVFRARGPGAGDLTVRSPKKAPGDEANGIDLLGSSSGRAMQRLKRAVLTKPRASPDIAALATELRGFLRKAGRMRKNWPSSANDFSRLPEADSNLGPGGWTGS